MTLQPTPVVSVKPVLLPVPDRGTDLRVRVSAPIAGDELPVVVFSHGYGKSLDDYAPLVDHWTAHGLVVVQPTHLDSKTLAIPPDDPRTPEIWRFRIDDLVRVVDALDTLVGAVPGLSDRVDGDKIAVAGHSWGATTASALLGARVIGTDEAVGEDMTDPRVTAGVLLALAGEGGENLTPFAAQHFPFMSPDFSRMIPPALLVAGDQDQSLLSVRGPDWWSDGYRKSPGDKSLLTLFGAQHSLGGISGYAAAETTDENPDRVALLARVTTDYLHHVLTKNDAGWKADVAALRDGTHALGRLETN